MYVKQKTHISSPNKYRCPKDESDEASETARIPDNLRHVVTVTVIVIQNSASH